MARDDRTSYVNRGIVLVVTGLLSIPAFTLQDHLIIKAVQCLLFVVLAAAAARRIRVVPTASVFLAVLAVHLFFPAGKVLVRVAGWPLTLGALETGLDKALLVVGLVFLSRYSVRLGALSKAVSGTLLGMMLVYFEELTRSARLRTDNGAATDEQGVARAGIPKSLGEVVRRLDDALVAAYAAVDGGGTEAERSLDCAATGDESVSGAASAPATAVAAAALQWLLFLAGRLSLIPDIGDLL